MKKKCAMQDYRHEEAADDPVTRVWLRYSLLRANIIDYPESKRPLVLARRIPDSTRRGP